MKLNAYLNFNGSCEAAFNFYEQVLGAKIQTMMKHKGTPVESQTKPEWLDKVMHARIQIGDQIVMASDSPPEYYEGNKGIYLTLGFDDPAETDRVYKALSEGGEIVMPIDETFFASRFGMFRDKFGTPWMVVCEKK